MAYSVIVDEKQRHGKRRIRLDLTNGMRIAALANFADDSPTKLINGLAEARTSDVSVMPSLPLPL